MPEALVSIVIPAYNPNSYLLEAIASASAQTYSRTEIVLVNDGSDKPDSREILERASLLVSTYLEQPNRGPSAARNAAFRASSGEFIVPLDADDLLEPGYIAECLAAFGSDIGFVYTDYFVFGSQNYREHVPEFNLYKLLDRNFLSYSALIHRSAWEEAGGYDEAMLAGYEDWEFWLRLGAFGHFGRRLSRPLFRYRKHGLTRSDTAEVHHAEIVAYIQERHQELYEYENRARIKARWSPAVSIVALEPPTNQTILDVQVIAPGEAPLAPAILDPHGAELAALAAWSGIAPNKPSQVVARNSFHRHLYNAELLSLRSWTHYPIRSLSRLIPLRVKERINKSVGRTIFDLSFYLQFQPNSVLFGDVLAEPLVYYPKPAQGRKRVALVTTHLGPGGAEAVLYDIASTLCSDRFETLLLATQSRDDRWLAKWSGRADHVYDLAQVVTPERMTAAICSVISNWRCDYLVLQNSLYGYAALPHLKKMLPEVKVFDLIHSVDEAWDQIGSTAGVAAHIDLRIAMAELVRDRLLATGTPESKIMLVRNGVDLERFQPSPNNSGAIKNILFAARLDPVKQPLLAGLVAKELAMLRPQRDFRFIVAGDGPERERMQQLVRKIGIESAFEFRGHVADLAPLYATADIVLLTSRSEGVPLVVLEALASARPVVAGRAGSIGEVLDSSCGVLVDLPDALKLAQAVHELLDKPDVRTEMGAAGRRKVETNHDIRKTREMFTSLFDQGSSVSVASTSRSTAME